MGLNEAIDYVLIGSADFMSFIRSIFGVFPSMIKALIFCAFGVMVFYCMLKMLF